MVPWQYAKTPARLVLIKADGPRPLIEAVGIVIAPFFFTFPIILCLGWAKIAQSPTQPVHLLWGGMIVVVVVVCIVGAIRHCNVVQSSATNLLVAIIAGTDKVTPIRQMQQVRFFPRSTFQSLLPGLKGGQDNDHKNLQFSIVGRVLTFSIVSR